MSIAIFISRGSFLVFLHTGARIAPLSTCVELIGGKDVIRIHGYVRIVPRKNSGVPRRPPTGGLGLVPGARQAERGSVRSLDTVNHRLAERRKSGPCSNVRRWGPAAGARCQPRAFTSPQNEKSPRFVRHLYQQVADSSSWNLLLGVRSAAITG